MFSKRVLKELLDATSRYPGGLVVLEDNRPKFVILDYESYKKIAPKPLKSASSEKPKNILVTGGAGYIGSITARLLIDRGYEVTTLDNLSTGIKEFAQGRFVEGDLADKKFVEEVFEQGQFDAVMHFAASIDVEESIQNPLKYYKNNVLNGLNLLETMVRHGVNRMIFSSSCTVYSESAPIPISEIAPRVPASSYGETKLIFENLLQWFATAYDLSSISLRYFNAVGASLDQTLGLANPESSLLLPNVLDVALGRKDILTVHGGDYKTHDGTAIRDYIHVLDLAESHSLALDYLFAENRQHAVSECYNVGSGRGYSVLEIINTVCEYTGQMVRFEIGPRRPGDREKVIADPSKIKRVLDFEPKYSSLKTIIETSWAFHKRRFSK